jgi:small conductance mechanosensitive channel
MKLSTSLANIFEELGINPTLVTWTARIIGLVVIWTAVWILVRYLSQWIMTLDQRVDGIHIKTRDLNTLDRLLDYVVILVGLLISLAVLGWTSLLYSALTAAGIFSVMIGFAVKDVAANFISGIFILIDQPFAPGDFIKVGDYSGTVKDVSLRTTALTSLDGPVVFIPNSVVAVQPTTNYSIAKARRIGFTVSIANDTDVDKALVVINAVLEEEGRLLRDRSRSVLVNEVREYAVDIGVYCYSPADLFIELASELKHHVMTALQAADVELAIPTRKNVNVELSSSPADDSSNVKM